jgi:hypothetical protein
MIKAPFMKSDMRADNTFIFNVMESRALFNWVPVTTAWRVVMLRLGETVCSMQSRSVDKRWSFSLVLVEGLTRTDHQNRYFVKCHKGVVLGHIFRPPEQGKMVDGCETWPVTL